VVVRAIHRAFPETGYTFSRRAAKNRRRRGQRAIRYSLDPVLQPGFSKIEQQSHTAIQQPEIGQQLPGVIISQLCN
jgi:hypothetical protein